MARYIITGSKFNPFTFQELIQPVQIAEQNYREVEDAYTDLLSKASVWEGMANSQTDPRAYARYQKFSDDLNTQIDRLVKEGLTPSSRQDIMRMRGRYSKEILPIEQAYQKRAEDIQRQKEISDKTGGRTIFSRDARLTSLDEYLGKTPEDFSQVNLDQVTASGMQGASTIASRYFNTEEGTAFGNDYYNLITTQGLNSAEALEVLRRSGKYPDFENFIQGELNKVGAAGNSKFSSYDRARIEDALMQGINMGMTYKETPKLIDRMAREQFEWTKARWVDENLGTLLPNGNRVKDVGGGRVRITKPDGTVEVIAAPTTKSSTSTSSNSKKKGVTKSGETFKGFRFSAWRNSSPNMTKFERSTTVGAWKASDEEKISFNDLSDGLQSKLEKYLAEYNMTPDDVDIFRDEDKLNRNEYQVRLKHGVVLDIGGGAPQTPVSAIANAVSQQEQIVVTDTVSSVDNEDL